ncbi:MAG: hydrogenase nickel incorporation protein HypB [Bacillota bacterium]|nr:hydrogenase nickel incorporation protein HypB [Bacillota bacterium]
MEINLQANVLGANAAIAQGLREEFARRGVYSINLISSPGAGKTTVVERLCALLKDKVRLAVIEGDITTSLDAERVARYGIPVHQINTFGGCHLDARMVERALQSLDLEGTQLLLVENVGNLVCPADFDLGEDAKMVVLSIPEGDDKPAKYPATFRRAAAVLLNKIDLLPYFRFDLARVKRELVAMNPQQRLFETVATTGQGMDAVVAWLVDEVQRKQKAAGITR